MKTKKKRDEVIRKKYGPGTFYFSLSVLEKVVNEGGVDKHVYRD